MVEQPAKQQTTQPAKKKGRRDRRDWRDRPDPQEWAQPPPQWYRPPPVVAWPPSPWAHPWGQAQAPAPAPYMQAMQSPSSAYGSSAARPSVAPHLLREDGDERESESDEE